MLVLSRKVGESIRIDGGIVITIVDIRGNRIRVGIDAPRDCSIVRAELGDAHSQSSHCETHHEEEFELVSVGG